jgi:hydrogenase expression/formation protein HypE
VSKSAFLLPVIRGVLFDFDGTLTAPGSIDFAAVRQAIGCPGETPILEYIDALPRSEKDQALRLLDAHETAAAKLSRPNAGAEDLIRHLRSKSVPLGIFSRNSRRSILEALRHFRATTAEDFQAIISRDDAEPKPDPAGVLLAAWKLGVEVECLLNVGDYVFDIEAAQRAGAPTVLLSDGAAPFRLNRPPDYTIGHLSELEGLVETLLPLSVGKLPNRFLERFLAENPLDDPSLLIRPGLGEDTAAVQLGEDENVIVLKSDPITFSADQLGYSTVVINANDVATSGATPRWLLTTLLFPEGSNAAQVHALMHELQTFSREFGLSLCGGHTEVTDAVTRVVAVGQLVGTVPRDRLIDKRRMAAGDQVLLTKAVALEGTSILTRDFADRLEALGLGVRDIENGRRFLTDPGISILKEAAIAADIGGLSALHDVTEGGLATGLEELSAAGGQRIRVYMERIPVFPETQRLCDLLRVEPLGLLGSGSLLIVCKPESGEKITKACRDAGIDVARIGEVLDDGTGIEAYRGKKQVPWPQFEVDEITRAIGKLGAA